MKSSAAPSKFRPLSSRDLGAIEPLKKLGPDVLEAMKVVSTVLPFRSNQYVVDSLIDWDRAPDDPMFQLTFPQRDMLEPEDFAQIQGLLRANASGEEIKAAADAVRLKLNPHPAGQLEHNVPMLDGKRVDGIQHKYNETLLFFPAQGQTCHAYCSYCFRWPQFVGDDDLKFASRETETLVAYLKAHPEVNSVLFTGGDPLIMRSTLLRRYVEPLLAADLPNLTSIRFGTKSLAYWPQRFTTDADADDVLRLFEQVVASGRTLAFMAHYSHAAELSTPEAEAAVRRVLSTGAVIRCQAPIIRHVNDDPMAWSDLWRREVQLGAVPYYMFVARDTGAQRYFEVPLVRAHEIYREAFSQVSGLARTVRGPSMSTSVGKVVVDGLATIGGEDVFVLRLLQARDPAWVARPFFARRNDAATWFDQLEPAFGEPEFFFSAALRELDRKAGGRRLPLLHDGIAA